MDKREDSPNLSAIHRKLALDTRLIGVDLRVYLLLLSQLDFLNFCRVSQIEIAEELGKRKEQISRSMGKLKRKGLIIEGPKVQRSRVWRLNPNYGK